MDAAPISLEVHAVPVPAPAADAVEAVLGRVARLAAHAFGVPFAQLIRFDPSGDGAAWGGLAPRPVSHGRLGETVPDLRLACTGLPADAALVLVEDTAKDVRFSGVLPHEGRFFAYAALDDGVGGPPVGALCLLDRRPRVPGSVAPEPLLDLALLAAEVLRARSVSDATAERLRLAEARHAAREAALGESEARFRALGEALFGAVFVSDDGVIVDANAAAAELLGLDDADGLIGCALSTLAPMGDAASAAALADDTPTDASRPATLALADGAPLAVRLHVRPFPSGGRLLRLTVVQPAG